MNAVTGAGRRIRRADDIAAIDFAKGGGLIPAIVQDADTLQVLTLAYMDAAALGETLESGEATFFSRSRGGRWRKGETSGNRLHVVDIVHDCDADAVLVKVRPLGPACHEGTVSCFEGESAPGAGFLAALEAIIDGRLKSPDPGSYTASLAAKGLHKAAQKVGEEGVEVALATLAEDDEALLGEAADLMFHLLLVLRMRALRLDEVMDVLRARHQQRTG
ncbi:MAG: bifunctional phosphoribosyl-AMP cyclohydrolase/phosphoribosyl-ATP diphosphatase HisIE [Brevundimonas sp.]|uniref:bifunctional phosphoribosyl-AMP cyclohydrolase/phosphoribosyl-ATP diphosphatase HisIE n=1 Tax=Brevundimonas sp. TaxID=1871086 RepID=UPI00391C6E13